jgi:hypothetical protein
MKPNVRQGASTFAAPASTSWPGENAPLWRVVREIPHVRVMM